MRSGWCLWYYLEWHTLLLNFFFLLASTPAPVPVADFVSPPRPNVGGQGRTIQLRANYFQISIPKGFIQHYEVAISPDKCPRRVNRSVGCSLLSMFFDLEQFSSKYWEMCARIWKVFICVYDCLDSFYTHFKKESLKTLPFRKANKYIFLS